MAPILTIFRIRSAQTKKTKEARWIAIQEIETQHLKVKKAESKCLLQIQDARPQSHQMIKVITFKCRNDLCIVIAICLQKNHSWIYDLKYLTILIFRFQTSQTRSPG